MSPLPLGIARNLRMSPGPILSYVAGRHMGKGVQYALALYLPLSNPLVRTQKSPFDARRLQAGSSERGRWLGVDVDQLANGLQDRPQHAQRSSEKFLPLSSDPSNRLTIFSLVSIIREHRQRIRRLAHD
jgi:hypothetical protein